MARKEKTIHYLYRTTCNLTGRWYIGMHSTTKLDDGYMGSGKILRYSIRKYGVENHTKEILEFFETREELILREQEIVTKELISDGKCMNLKEGGQGGFSNKEHMTKCVTAGGKARIKGLLKWWENNEEQKQKNSDLVKQMWKDGKYQAKDNSGDKNGMYGKTHSKESRQKMSDKKKGENNNQYDTCWITKDNINKKIKKDEIETYLKEGWIKGRKIIK